MKLLLDTNIFLEVMLNQAQANDARKLLSTHSKHTFHLSLFSLYSLGVILTRQKSHTAFENFIADLPNLGIHRVSAIDEKDLAVVTKIAKRWGFDFDDAYQVAVAQKLGLKIVSFDKDLSRGPLPRITPLQVLAHN